VESVTSTVEKNNLLESTRESLVIQPGDQTELSEEKNNDDLPHDEIHTMERDGLLACKKKDWETAKIYVNKLKQSGYKGEKIAEQIEQKIQSGQETFLDQYWWLVLGGVLFLFFLFLFIAVANS
jgi:hypothetical protein